jgi:hypothetical protein
VPKLNQILGVRDGVKNRVEKAITALHRTAPAAFAGISRVYRPIDDNDVVYPPESTLVQVKGIDVVAQFRALLTELMDVIATTDVTNCTAKADIVLGDGTVLAEQVPAVTLLFVEKKIEDIRTFLTKLPVLDPSEEWTLDPIRGIYATGRVETLRMKKVHRNHVLAEATKEHPAQVQIVQTDTPEGSWLTTRFSGAFPEPVIQNALRRLETIRQAVVYARNQANSTEVTDLKIGENILRYIFLTMNAN